MKFKTVGLVALACLAFLFILQNLAIVQTQFFFWSIEMSQALLMLFVFLAGLIIGWFLHGYRRSSK